MRWLIIAFWIAEAFILIVFVINVVSLISGSYDPEYFWLILLLSGVMLVTGVGTAYLIYKGKLMKIGVAERVRERSRIAAAVATAEKYRGINLMDTPEAKTLPTPRRLCSNEGRVVGYPRYRADKMYWVGVPAASVGGLALHRMCRKDGRQYQRRPPQYGSLPHTYG